LGLSVGQARFVRSTLLGVTRRSGQQNPPVEVTVTTCNARWGHDIDDNPFDLDRVIERFDSDIICLQELWEPESLKGARQAHAEALGYHVVELAQAPSYVDPSPEITADPLEADGTWGIALLTRLPIKQVRIVDLGRLFERWDVAHRRAIVADVEIAETTISVAVVHCSFVLPNAVAQLRRLSGALPRDRASIVAGDCNLWGPAASVALSRHRRSVTGRTWPTHRPHSQLDHIFISPEIDLVEGRIGDPTGSDHLPVHATLRINQ